MNFYCSRSTQIATLTILFMAIGMTACGAGSVKWKEEVQLSDGRIIVVERETIRERGGDEWAANRGGSKPKEYRIQILNNPNESGKGVEWRSTKKSPQTWPEVPVVFDMEAGQPVVFSIGFTTGGCNTYFKYRYQNGAWVEEKLPQKFGQRAANLLIFDDNDMTSLIKLKMKKEKNSDSHTRGFRQVGPVNPDCRFL